MIKIIKEGKEDKNAYKEYRELLTDVTKNLPKAVQRELISILDFHYLNALKRSDIDEGILLSLQGYIKALYQSGQINIRDKGTLEKIFMI